MKCSDRKLVDYLDGSLAQGLMRELERHLLTCADCREQLEEYRQALDLVGSVELPPLSHLHVNSAVPQVRSRLASRHSGLGGLRRLWAPALSGALGGAVVIIALSAIDWTAPVGNARHEVMADVENSGGELVELATAVVDDFEPELRDAMAEEIELMTEDLALELETYLMETAPEMELLSEAELLVLRDGEYYSLLEVY